MLFGLGIIIVFAVSLIGPVMASAPGIEAWHTLTIAPFTDVLHINTNPGGWLNGYVTTPSYTVPLLGKGEGNTAYICWDLPAGGIEMALIVITISTRDGYMMRISDDLSLTGPEYVWLTPASSQSVEGPTTDEGAGSQVTPQAWHYLHVNPWATYYWLSTNRVPWLWGYDADVSLGYPVLGYGSGNKFCLATDFWEGSTGYELSFKLGTISSRDGYSQRTFDGMSYAFDYFWLT
jgi:hypothetical protein